MPNNNKNFSKTLQDADVSLWLEAILQKIMNVFFKKIMKMSCFIQQRSIVADVCVRIVRKQLYLIQAAVPTQM